MKKHEKANDSDKKLFAPAAEYLLWYVVAATDLSRHAAGLVPIQYAHQRRSLRAYCNSAGFKPH